MTRAFFRLFRLTAMAFTLTFLPGGVARADSLAEANDHYAAGAWAQAAAACEQLIAADGATAARLYTLGNARYQLGDFGPAILAYERAATLAPRDPDIRANLKLARTAAAAFTDQGTAAWWQRAAQWFSLHEWSWITLTSAALAGLTALVRGLTGPRRARLRRATVIAIVTGSTAALIGGAALWSRRGEKNLGIVTNPAATLRLSPFPTADPAATPGPGRTVHLGERARGWVFVTLPGTAQTGWLPEQDVTAIVP